MEILKTQEGSNIILKLSGSLNTETASKLQEVLIPELEAGNNVVLDFLELKHISSAGLRVLLIGEKVSKTAGSKQTFRGILPEIMEILQITGFSSILHIEQTES